MILEIYLYINMYLEKVRFYKINKHVTIEYR